MEDLRELGPGVVALYTLVGEDNYRVILTTADFQKGYEYSIKAADLNRKVLEFRIGLQETTRSRLTITDRCMRRKCFGSSRVSNSFRVIFTR